MIEASVEMDEWGEHDDKPHEACGVVGVYYPQHPERVATIVHEALEDLQHRGQDAAGISVFGETHTTVKSEGLVSDVFHKPHELEKLGDGSIGIGHVRYSTNEIVGLDSVQPFSKTMTDGRTVSLAHNGNIINTEEIAAKVAHPAPGMVSDTVLILDLIAHEYNQADDNALPAAVKRACQQLKGAFCLTVGTEDQLIAVRDSQGFHPLMLAELDDGGVMVASESCALTNDRVVTTRDISPAEMVVIDESGVHSEVFTEPNLKLCAMELIYFARPDSAIDGKRAASYRRQLGEMLAQKDKEAGFAPDLVIGVPESGIPAGTAYGAMLEVRVDQSALIKNRYVTRSFIAPDLELRPRIVRRKFQPDHELMKGKKVVLVDDSIVGGVTMTELVSMVRRAGAIEVHLRITSPRYKWPCFYGIATGDSTKLIANSMTTEEFASEIGVDSLVHLTTDDLRTAAGETAGALCMACFDGHYPTEI